MTNQVFAVFLSSTARDLGSHRTKVHGELSDTPFFKCVHQGGLGAEDASAILQVKVWLVGISPMVWRRVLVPASFTLRELHGVIQVTMGWEGIHLYDLALCVLRGTGGHTTLVTRKVQCWSVP